MNRSHSDTSVLTSSGTLSPDSSLSRSTSGRKHDEADNIPRKSVRGSLEERGDKDNGKELPINKPGKEEKEPGDTSGKRLTFLLKAGGKLGDAKDLVWLAVPLCVCVLLTPTGRLATEPQQPRERSTTYPLRRR